MPGDLVPRVPELRRVYTFHDEFELVGAGRARLGTDRQRCPENAGTTRFRAGWRLCLTEHDDGVLGSAVRLVGSYA
jgi:hypothetical protein